MLAEALKTHSSAPSPDFQIQEGGMDAALQAAIGRMMDWCARQPQGAAFMARGFVVDTMGDIGQQITSYFPTHIDVTPVLDDMSFVVGQNAQQSGQRFQEVMLDYIGDGKIPEAARANMQTFVKWYGIGSVAGGDYEGNHKRLKPGWSGGAGGSGADMLKHLNLGTKKGFLLQVCALDITDARAQSLLADMPAMQAFGGSPAAMQAIADVVAKGGAPADTVREVATLVAEIKTIKAALVQAGESPKAAPLAAALALKTEALAARLPVMQAALPAPARVELARVSNAIKVEMHARQITTALTTIAQALPPALVAKVANDVPHTKAPTVEIARAIETLRTESKAADMPVRDAIVLALTGDAPPAIASAVRAVVAVMAQPNFLPALEHSIPAAPAKIVREALTTPVMQAASNTPAPLTPVAQGLKAVAQSMQADAPALPTIKMAAHVLEQAAMTPPTLRAPALQSVAENLQAVTMTAAIPAAMKPQIHVAIAQVEALAVQARTPAPVQPTMPMPLHEQAPLAALGKAVGVTAPAAIPPAPVEARKITEAQPVAAKASVVEMMGATNPTAKAPDVAKDKPAASGRCSGCFNKSCAACTTIGEKAAAQMNAIVDADLAGLFTAIKPPGLKMG
ncbi:MAG: hypothetical protein KGQ41_01505 [Alphaproteobacteria bacterium]|nr:hypothetical protein [Alphaproteobacteria bacterium]